MIPVLPDFKTEMLKDIKNVKARIVLQDGTEINPDGDLQSVKLDWAGATSTPLLKTAMRKAEIKIFGEHDLTGKAMDIFIRVYKEDSDEWLEVLQGKFEASKSEYSKDTEVTTVTAYDNMMRFYSPYQSTAVFPTTLLEYLQSIASAVGVQLVNTDLPILGALTIDVDPFASISEASYRDALEDICEVSTTQAIITPEGWLHLRQITDTEETLTPDNLIEFSTGEVWGGVNSVVLAREPQTGDDIYQQDEDDINSPTTRNILNMNAFIPTYTNEEGS